MPGVRPVTVDFQRAENKLMLRAPDEFKLRAVWDVVQEKMVRRQVPEHPVTPSLMVALAKFNAHTVRGVIDLVAEDLERLKALESRSCTR